MAEPNTALSATPTRIKPVTPKRLVKTDNPIINSMTTAAPDMASKDINQGQRATPNIEAITIPPTTAKLDPEEIPNIAGSANGF